MTKSEIDDKNDELKTNDNDVECQDLYQVEVPESTRNDNEREEQSMATHNDEDNNLIENSEQSIKKTNVAKNQRNNKKTEKSTTCPKIHKKKCQRFTTSF